MDFGSSLVPQISGTQKVTTSSTSSKSGVPFYLQPTMTTTEKDTSVDVFKALEWSYDYDYQNTPEPQGTTSFWEDISTPVTQGGAFVWDTAKGAWESAKTATTELINVVDSAGTKISDTIFGGIDSILIRGGIIFAALVAGVWFLAKSGILKQLASI